MQNARLGGARFYLPCAPESRTSLEPGKVYTANEGYAAEAVVWEHFSELDSPRLKMAFYISDGDSTVPDGLGKDQERGGSMIWASSSCALIHFRG